MISSSREASCEARGVTLIATGALRGCHRFGWRRARMTMPNVPWPTTPSAVYEAHETGQPASARLE